MSLIDPNQRLSFRKENLGHSAKQLIHKKEKENKENQMDLEQEWVKDYQKKKN